MNRQLTLFVILALCYLLPWYAMAAMNIDIEINQEVEVNVQRHGVQGDELLLWLPSESGLLPEETKHAQTLAASGHSVWLADLLTAWFLPALASSIEQLPAEDIALLVEKVRQLSKKKVYLVANGRGALLALRVANVWQQQYGKHASLGGVIMLSPKLFVETPEPGQTGEYMPVVKNSNLPVFIIQPAQSPWRWKLDSTIPALEQSGSDVFTWVLPGSRDRFYYRPDATLKEEQLANRLPELLVTGMRLLSAYNKKPRTAKVQQQVVMPVTGKKERLLRTYAGDKTPPDLQLKSLQGEAVNLSTFKGTVVLVNFWASWCPPCVHEMPSMQQLDDHFKGRPFEILAVNMAESQQTVKTFLEEKVNVRFPILMDTDGAALKRWKVFAFPTSYVIDKQGKISLALFGSINWMEEDVVKKIENLITAEQE